MRDQIEDESRETFFLHSLAELLFALRLSVGGVGVLLGIMVSTRRHAEDFSVKARASPVPTKRRASSPSRSEAQKWGHTSSTVVMIWLFLSIPLVLWDAGYVLLRPYSMPGGKLHAPIWTPYALYGTIDYIYGWPAFNEGNGFTAAQVVLNLVETVGYMAYLYMVYGYGVPIKGRGYTRNAGNNESVSRLLKSKCVVSGRPGAIALLVGYSASVMTVSKTILYWLNEYFAGFENIGHNPASTLIPLWIVPK